MHLQRLRVTHTTTYSYSEAVEFGEHRLMVRPRDSHDLRLLDATLSIEPTGHVRWLYDVFGNSVAVITFDAASDKLRITSDIVIDRYPSQGVAVGVEDYAKKLPFSYPATEIPDLGRTIERHYSDPERVVAEWTRGLLERDDVDGQTEAFLSAITHAIKNDFQYTERHEPGVQDPIETIEKMSGSCRDYAILMMEAVRSVGLAARFVSGYLYDPALDGGDSGTVGAGATHAWVQVYLPGSGWIEFDPTNGDTGGHNLVPIAVARTPGQAVPISGTFSGEPDRFIAMDVEVAVRSLSASENLA